MLSAWLARPACLLPLLQVSLAAGSECLLLKLPPASPYSNPWQQKGRDDMIARFQLLIPAPAIHAAMHCLQGSALDP